MSGDPYDAECPKPTYEKAEMTAEIRSFFGTGVNLQEMYIAPELMTPRTWDVLAEAARWARRNADVLADTHHVGGNPLAGEVYGWASWTPAKAIMALRIRTTARHVCARRGPGLELPAGAATKYVEKSLGRRCVTAQRGSPIGGDARVPFPALRGVGVGGRADQVSILSGLTRENTARMNHAIAIPWNVGCRMRDCLAGLRREAGQGDCG